MMNLYVLVSTDTNGYFDHKEFTTMKEATDEMKRQYDCILKNLSSKYLAKDFYSVFGITNAYAVDEVKSIQSDWHIITIKDIK